MCSRKDTNDGRGNSRETDQGARVWEEMNTRGILASCFPEINTKLCKRTALFNCGLNFSCRVLMSELMLRVYVGGLGSHRRQQWESLDA
jgi:hypothetical protein